MTGKLDMDQILQAYVDTPSSSSSSYFDFVDEKADLQSSASETTAMELANPGTDAFVVQVMDEESSRALKQRYFGKRAVSQDR